MSKNLEYLEKKLNKEINFEDIYGISYYLYEGIYLTEKFDDYDKVKEYLAKDDNENKIQRIKKTYWDEDGMELITITIKDTRTEEW